ncbi:MAG: dihydrolipoamide acetyltransferase family protein [Planctomycetota bacterium]|jgi:pyruvate dehydrogenase E2 component (dihydrolipoamide acetyltransferase)
MQFKLPDLGEGVHEGQIVRVHVKEGDSIREDEPLLEVETDKAAVEIPSPFTGVVTKVHVEEQQLVHVGDVMIEVNAEGATAAPAEAKAAADVTTAPTPVSVATAAPTAPAGATRGAKRASPAVRRLARTTGIDLAMVAGTGAGGRVTRADVEAAASGTARPAAATPTVPLVPGAPAVPAPPPPPTSVPPATPHGTTGSDQYGATVRQPMSQARRTIARVMAESWTTIPHVTDTHDCDVTLLDQLRRGYESPENHDSPERVGRKLTMLAFIVRAVVRAVQRFPEFNASFDEEAGEIVYRRYINVAIGVHTERGLIAPVIKDTDQLGVIGIADALSRIAEKARTASFAVNDTRGGTYTISNPGALGTSRYSTPIITPPQVAVLGLGRTRKQPWVVDDAIVPRLILPLSHSFDHRIIDGGNELGFMRHLIDDLENPARLLL